MFKMFKSVRSDQQESVFFGVLGSLLFSLLGASLIVVCWKMNVAITLGGPISVWGAVFAYYKFGGKLTRKGMVISIVFSSIDLIVAWHLGLVLDIYRAYSKGYALGMVDFKLTFAEALANPYAFFDSEMGLAYIMILSFTIAFYVTTCWYLVAMFKEEVEKVKKVAEQQSDLNDDESNY